MHRTQLFTEILDQIEKQSSWKIESCFEAKDSELIFIRRVLMRICSRLSLDDPRDLFKSELDRLSYREWLEICAQWLTYSSPLLGTNRPYDSPSWIDESDSPNLDDADLLMTLLTEATIFLLEEESQLYDAATQAVRLFADVYRAARPPKLFSDEPDDQRF
jgi:hypothetical protein